MNVFLKIGVVAIIYVGLSVVLKPNRPEYVFLMRVCTVGIVFALLLDDVSLFISNILSMFSVFNIESSHINLLLKVVGVTIITDFLCDTLNDTGEKSLAGVVAIASKFLILYLALPILNGLIIFSLKILE